MNSIEILLVVDGTEESVTCCGGERTRACPGGDGPADSPTQRLRVDGEQSGREGVGPEGIGYRLPEELSVAPDLIGGAHAHGHVRDGRVPIAERQRGGGKRRAVCGRELRELLRLLHDRGRGILVVVLRLGERVLVGEDARVEDPDVDDSYAAALALGDELFTSTLFEQRVATGLHDEVDIGLADETGEHL